MKSYELGLGDRLRSIADRLGSLLGRNTVAAPKPYVPKRYNVDTINASAMEREGRSAEDYARVLGFDLKELAGKRVLDLGAGPTARLARELEAADSRTQVVSLSPDFADPRHYAVAAAAHKANLVAGLGQELPFIDGSFDVVLAYHLAEHTSQVQRMAMLKEMARVLAPGGFGRLGPDIGFPIWNYHMGPYDRSVTWCGIVTNVDGVADYLTDAGVVATRHPIPSDILPPVRMREMGMVDYLPQEYIALERPLTSV